MRKHIALYEQIRSLRSNGLTYTEINENLGVNIAKSSYSYICKDIFLNKHQINRINQLSKERLIVYRQKALQVNRQIFQNKLKDYRLKNAGIADLITSDRQAQLIALAMLYLGEGAKWKGRRGLMLGNADPKILTAYIDLLELCYDIPRSKMRARIQHRADQNSKELVNYWSKVTSLEKEQFYPSYVDKRTIGKPTKKAGYHGVCSISCAGTHVQLELEQIADIINKAIRGRSSVD